MALIMISFQIKQPKHMIIMQAMAQIGFTVHFFMIGSVSGAVQNLISVVRGIFLASGVKALRSSRFMFLFAGIYLVSPVAIYFLVPGTALSWIDFLPAVAMMINTFCIWYLNSRLHRMSQFFVVSPLWITYNIVNTSYSGIITELFNAVSSLIFLIRTHAFRRRKKGDQNEV